MIIYFVIFIFVIFLVFFIMVWIRKTLWDAVHRNLLDFEDYYKGRVGRRNIFNPPVFSGKIDSVAVTINFSSAREQNRRVNYINLSMESDSPVSFSIVGKEWLKIQDAGPLEDFLTLENDKGKAFILRPVSKKSVKKIAQLKEVKELLNICEDMSYIYFGPTGILFEQESAELLKDTEHETLIKKIMQIIKLGRKINEYKNS